VIAKGPDWFAIQASGETLSKTTLGQWNKGTRINLERALKLGDELGGHIVSGHVDGIGQIVAITPDGESRRFRIRVPLALARFIAPKGSVAIDGTSLTVNEVDGPDFGVNIIPHTQAVTTWGDMKVGQAVNIEIDMLARYVARLAEFGKS
jgi:riboflavin synthase